jgi:inorganic phosphate transporter, PiT family
VVAVLLAIGFAVTNGLHDASNAIATLVATRAATPLQAILLASVFNLLGPLFLGAAVADTIGGIVTVPPDVTVEVIGAGLAAAVTWNLVTWRLGLPSTSRAWRFAKNLDSQTPIANARSRVAVFPDGAAVQP